jgi:hypothetical protein
MNYLYHVRGLPSFWSDIQSGDIQKSPPLFIQFSQDPVMLVVGGRKVTEDRSPQVLIKRWGGYWQATELRAAGIAIICGAMVAACSHGRPKGATLSLRQPVTGSASAEIQAKASVFRPFAPKVKTFWDQDYLYVESNGLPDHRMMVGITAWQQQVPLPQDYTGENAWRIPLRPIPATDLLSAKTHFFRGAIALAANGVPIFNPIKNDGVTDTYLAGELDEFGGHSGRGDDYHYHIAPIHLAKRVGKGNPIAFALDGYPIFGLTEPDGSLVSKLDEFNGHEITGKPGNVVRYHYHATRNYPYINGGFHGNVTESGGQVDPQPRIDPLRPAGEPLPGATITGFDRPRPGAYSLTYTIQGETRNLNYALLPDGSYRFDSIDGTGKTQSNSYRPRPARGL